jgi:hypothetical protein
VTLTIHTLIFIVQVVRIFQVHNTSLRHNRISPTDTVASVLMIKGYPDTHPSGSSSSLSLSPHASYLSSLNSANSSVTGSAASWVISLHTSPTSITPISSSLSHSFGAAAKTSAPGSSQPGLPQPYHHRPVVHLRSQSLFLHSSVLCLTLLLDYADAMAL